jgi:GcrA cell cycle regulator
MTIQNTHDIELSELTKRQRYVLRSYGHLPRTNPWTDERVTELRRLVALALTGSQIGARFGMSRSQIMGKASRLRLVVGGGRKAPSLAGAAKRAANRARMAAKRLQSRTARQAKLVQAQPWRGSLLACDAVPASECWKGVGKVGLIELEPHHCRWPLGEHPAVTFCGADSYPGLPYCGRHAAICYRPSSRAE